MIDLKFDRVSKKYRIYHESEEKKSAFGRLTRRLRGNWDDFWALRDVTFEVERGEALGIIGQNGAGKSTILKLLYSITAPTKGKISVNGRLAALIEVASGFHPELTGRENVFLNGSLLGMKRREIKSKLDSIVDFAGVSAFIDTPVKRYSSGMYLRLGFSIAAHLDPDILLLDEVLAVGDAAFQSKCIERIHRLRKQGTTIIFISHNLGAVENLCDRVFLLRQGEIFRSGKPRDVISEYEHMLVNMPTSAPTGRADRAASPVQIASVNFYNSAGRKTTTFATGDEVRAEVEFVAHEPVDDALIEIYFYSIFHNLHSHLSTDSKEVRLDLAKGRGTVEFFCPELPFEPSAFNVEASIRHRKSDFTEHLDYKQAGSIHIVKGKAVHGGFHTFHTWNLKTEAPQPDHVFPHIS
ncbi:MAG TPA: polysaccharide ABC transporter ATP-binding protein [Pyrinomonadaceae bacterium]|nr:polysaccharide ABC transporter ATP-binding protein [Pyrinomonadaceae bacterium]